MESNANIEFIEENVPFSISETGPVKVLQSAQNTSTGKNQWNINAINVPKSWIDAILVPVLKSEY